MEKFIIQFKTTQKIGHHTRFRRNDDLALWQGPAVKKKLPFSNVCMLIMCEIVRSRGCTVQYWGMTLVKQKKIFRIVGTLISSFILS